MAAFSILERIEQSPGLLTVKQIAEIFGDSEKKIYNMVNKKQIPVLRLGGSIKFDPKSLGFWLRKKDPTLAAAEKWSQAQTA